MEDESAGGIEATKVGLALLESGGGSVGGLKDADVVISLRPTENSGLLLDRMHHRRHRQKRLRLNVMGHFS